MTPRPEIFAVPETMTLEDFLVELKENAFSRVPVFAGSLDHITGIAFARDLLQVLDSDAVHRTVAQLMRAAGVRAGDEKGLRAAPRDAAGEAAHARRH